jgi:CubicO group peptidase (beta-lactamase class C family)
MEHMMDKKVSPAKMESYIEAAMADWKIPGGAVAVVDNGEVVSSRGYGVRELGKSNAVDDSTRFAIGSCSKAFTAGVLGALVDEGQLTWDDKIVKFLPDFKMYDPWVTEQVTVRDMLCHRTGTMRSIRIMNRDRVFDAEDYIRRMEYLRPIGEFRSRFGYNNPHFIVAGKVAEVVGGMKWSGLLRKYIFEPLGMTSSTATYQEMLASGAEDVSSPHTNLDGGFIPAELRALDAVQPIPWTDYGENSAGSMISNLQDMTRWLRLLLQDGAHEGREIFSPQTLAEMTSPQMVIKPGESEMDPLFAVGLQSNIMSYGLGWYVTDYRGYKMVFHPGQLHGFVAAVAFLPQLKIGGVILLNVYQTMLHPMLGYYLFDSLMGIERDYSGEMKDLLGQWRVGAEMQIQRMLASRPAESQSAIPPDQLTGKYVSDLFGEISISLEDDKLIHYYGETDLFIADLELWHELSYIVNYRNKINPPEFLTFIPNEQGKVASLEVKDVDSFQRK